MLRIGEDYTLESVKLNIILRKKHLSKTGKDAWDEYYFATVPNALKYLVTLEVEETKLKDVKTVVDRINQVEAMIEKACAEIRVASLHES